MVAAGALFCATIPAAHVAAQEGVYLPPQCELNTGHFLVNSGVVYIKGASEETFPDQRQRMLTDAQRNLVQALERDQAENPAVWYFLGRYYHMTNDPLGADSAFDRAARLAPACADDISFYRQRMWVPLVNQAVDSINAGQLDAAKRLLRQANVIYDEDNVAFYYLGSVFGSENQIDSAVHYFRKVIEVGARDSTREENVDNATFNLASLYTSAAQWDSAVVWFRHYRERHPEDPQALIGLATAYAEAGNDSLSVIMYDSVLGNAAEMNVYDLLQAGQKLFIAGQLDAAARAFEAGLEKNPYHRDGLYNITNTYLAIAQDGEVGEARQQEAAAKMEQAARRLVAIEPHGQEALRLLAAAYQLERKSDSTLAVLQGIEDMRFAIEVQSAQPGEDRYEIIGVVSNMRSARTTVPPITFEFLDAEGNVITSEPLTVNPLAPHDTSTFEIIGEGEGIAAWRYRGEPSGATGGP
jgi:tetratricopeptide (TPR) repeat protein